ncbi:uncharacterized protein O3C94_016317 [Discoglossus pictus]
MDIPSETDKRIDDLVSNHDDINNKLFEIEQKLSNFQYTDPYERNQDELTYIHYKNLMDQLQEELCEALCDLSTISGPKSDYSISASNVRPTCGSRKNMLRWRRRVSVPPRLSPIPSEGSNEGSEGGKSEVTDHSTPETSEEQEKLPHFFFCSSTPEGTPEMNSPITTIFEETPTEELEPPIMLEDQRSTPESDESPERMPEDQGSTPESDESPDWRPEAPPTLYFMPLNSPEEEELTEDESHQEGPESDQCVPISLISPNECETGDPSLQLALTPIMPKRENNLVEILTPPIASETGEPSLQLPPTPIMPPSEKNIVEFISPLTVSKTGNPSLQLPLSPIMSESGDPSLPLPLSPIMLETGNPSMQLPLSPIMPKREKNLVEFLTSPIVSETGDPSLKLPPTPVMSETSLQLSPTTIMNINEHKRMGFKLQRKGFGRRRSSSSLGSNTSSEIDQPGRRTPSDMDNCRRRFNLLSCFGF